MLEMWVSAFIIGFEWCRRPFVAGVAAAVALRRHRNQDRVLNEKVYRTE